MIRQIFTFFIFVLVGIAVYAAAFSAKSSGEIEIKEMQTTTATNSNFGHYSKMEQLALREPDARIQMPVKGVRVSQIADTWGAARSGGRTHAGQDIFAKRGTPVYSATEGYVLRVGESNLGGKTVFVLGAGGRRYYHAHLDAFAPELKTGDLVTSDTLLGYVGTSGNAKGTPPHLHFGVYAAGGAINPMPLLTNRT